MGYIYQSAFIGSRQLSCSEYTYWPPHWEIRTV